MRQSTTVILMTLLLSQVYGAPQFITFKDGKIGVNFAGYHASAGLGGLGGEGGAAGGLFAEAGTPFGQSARAGLGGVVDSKRGTSGGLYAGATANENVKASAGLGGGVTAEKSAGNGFATAQAGNRFAASGLGGASTLEGSSGFKFSGTKSLDLSGGLIKEKEVIIKPVHSVEVVKKIEADNVVNVQDEVKPLPLTPIIHKKVAVEANPVAKVDANVKEEAPTKIIVKEVYVPLPTKVVEKEVYHARYKPHRHHFRKHAYIGGYIGGGGDIAHVPPPPPPAPVVYKTVKPVIEKRVDVGVASAVDADASAHAVAGGSGGGQYGYTKQVTFQRNPSFFTDIFNIPISTLKAVGNFLGNAAGSTSVSVQKTASVQADSDSVSSKHEPASLSSSSSSSSTISVQTPNASKVIDDILAIPINTLDAVGKFLVNNVPARKNLEVSVDDGAPTKVRLGPHARRRANKRVVIVQENTPESVNTE